MDAALFLHRLQFGFTVTFHYIFPQLTMGLALLIVVLNVMEPEAMAPLFHAWYGWVTMAVIVCTVGVGYHFIRKITAIDV